MVYSLSNGNIKTPKGVHFPTVVKLLCNNTEVFKLISHYGHRISNNLIEEIETEQALEITSEQKEKRVIIPDNMKSDDGESSVALMVADNIDNLECTLSGADMSHPVNSILVKKQTQVENQAINEQEELQPPTKRVCCRSLLQRQLTMKSQNIIVGNELVLES